MNRSRTNRWPIRAFSAVLLFLVILATSGVVQAITGAGTPCDSCGGRCYAYHAGIPKAQGGCREPWGMPDTACLAQKCQNWCDGCIPSSVNVIDCENPNCWLFDINVEGGTICSNGCFGARCSSDRNCGQVQQTCDGKNGSIPCSKCACQP